MILATETIEEPLSEEAYGREVPGGLHRWQVLPGITLDVIGLYLRQLGKARVLATSYVYLIFSGAMSEAGLLSHHVPPRYYKVVADILHIAKRVWQLLVSNECLSLRMLIDMNVEDKLHIASGVAAFVFPTHDEYLAFRGDGRGGLTYEKVWSIFLVEGVGV